MPLIQITTYKDIPYEEGSETYSNVYVYRVQPYPTLQGRRNLIEAVIDVERGAHSVEVLNFRGESRPMDETVTPAIPQASDGEFESPDPGNQPHNGNTFPQWVVLFQQRVAKRAWIRKYLHTFYTEPEQQLDPPNVWQWAQGDIDTLQASYGDQITNVIFNDDQGSAQDALLTTASGNDADPTLNADRRMRIHELKY